MKPLCLISLSLTFLFFHNLAFAQPNIPAFDSVEAGIYRGGRPGAQGIVELAQMGIHTVIDLEDSKSAVASEKLAAAKENLNFISIPTASFSEPPDKDVNRVLSLLQDPSLYPIFIHCQHGEDRTGLMIGLYRVFVDHWTPEKAYTEMNDLGFHKILFALDNYYKKRTGLH